MARSLLRKALRGLSLAQVRHVTPVPFRRAGPEVLEVYRAVESEFGVLAPPVVLHAAAPAALRASWVMLRDVVLAPGLLDRGTKEAVAAAVSQANECPYCVTVHTATTARFGGGRVDLADTGRFTADELPEVLGVATTLQYFNRMVSVFLTERPMPPYAPAFMLGPVTRMLTGLIASAVSTPPGRNPLPEAPLPDELAWAAGSPVVAQALARSKAVFDSAPVPEAARVLLAAELSTWDGRPKGPSRRWAWDAAARVGPRDRAAVRLALLCAFAPYQVDDEVIRDARADDAALIELAAWASMAAAVRATALTKSPA
ncbi:carboxymuconolactone decarboxylase family protein [Lentzea jiangxiensis]|uniref:Alkylhydroperoxidase AhpD family core domain-containing protein n=1 Tax=Lentzea jiangxiensis TaxID=641025 RepID=A0A1H0KU37_9PSEU|nr:carboxymuconolactone decarboxylase family protein [Lentzea jiangxiensis]SDO59301.1 alkylhydroperoxidase AhpD family core domain-containing protein [Lentzea jiangxiensis]